MWTNLNMVSLFKSLLCTLHKVNIFFIILQERLIHGTGRRMSDLFERKTFDVILFCFFMKKGCINNFRFNIGFILSISNAQ